MAAQSISFLANSQVLVVNTPHPGVWQVGMVGLLTIRRNGSFSFRVYSDPRLRCDSSIDNVPADQWGWRLGEYRFHAKAHIKPGINGAVIPEDVRPLRIDIPSEFVELCEEYRIAPIAALRAFIADVCELHNFLALPREDGYSSQGSDERIFARQYWDRAHEWRCEVMVPIAGTDDMTPK
jgi:hypothetical protein